MEKIPLELNLEIAGKSKFPIRLTKTLYTGFVPQHGMEVLDTEIFFRVRTTALAGLQTLKHTANPLTNGKWIEGNRRVVTKLFPKDDDEYREAIEFFTRQGWKIER